MFAAKKLVLAHFWVAFAAFLLAILLGEWQMYVRSPLHAWVNNPEHYYRSVTAHGTVMAYVMPTLVAMGFGYAITELSLKRPLIGVRWAWAGFWLVVAGTVIAAATVARGRASVLYTFYPPMIAQSVLLHRRRAGRRRVVDLGGADVDQPACVEEGQPGSHGPARDVRQRHRRVPVGVDVGRGGGRSPVTHPAGALGLKDTIDAGLSRVFFSWTLHAIVYFWLMPAYIAFYSIVPRAIGGRLYSDTMARVAFVLFLVFSMPIGMHHLFADPQVGAGLLPCCLASLRIAGFVSGRRLPPCTACGHQCRGRPSVMAYDLTCPVRHRYWVVTT